MNWPTTEALRALLGYWQDTPSVFTAEMVERCKKLLALNCPLDDEQLDRYFDLLTVACEFSGEGENISWVCGGGTDKSRSERVLAGMGLAEPDITTMHELVDVLGGHCDCEILFNAAPRMLPEEASRPKHPGAEA